MTVADYIELAGELESLRPLKLSALLGTRCAPATGDRILDALRREWNSSAAMTVGWLWKPGAEVPRQRLFLSLIENDGVPSFAPIVPGVSG